MDPVLTSRSPRLLRAAIVLALVGLFVLVGRPAQAEPILGPGTQPRSTFTELQVLPITGELGLSDVDAFDAPADFDPLGGYPAAVPPGSVANEISYMGLIPAQDAAGDTALTYCIDLFTSTQSGVNYERGEWSEANVPNLGYVAYILQNYYPTEPLPEVDEPDPAEADRIRAAAVQAAIWFFSDRLVLDPTTEAELFGLTSAIVADAIANGPAAEPQQPALSVSPTSASAPSTGELVGPFTVTADGPSTLRVGGVEVFSDAAGTQQLLEGATVPAGAQLWARTVSSDDPQGFALQRAVTVRESTVYLYDGSDPDRESAQKLILAQTRELEAVAGVRITPFAAGGIALTKTIAGPAAGLQDRVVIRVECAPAGGGDPVVRTVTIPAGTAAGTSPFAVTGLPAGAACTITEPEDGDNGLVNLTVTTIEPGTVTIVEAQNAPVAVTNEYERAVGGLRITKRITGPAAGDQGEVVITLDCDDAENAFDQELTIPAGSPAGSYPLAAVTGIPAGTQCTVAEAVTGVSDAAVLVTPVIIRRASVTVADGETTAVTITNTYRERQTGDGGQGGGGQGGGGAGGTLPDTGAPAGALPLTLLGLALLLGGTAVLTLGRRTRRTLPLRPGRSSRP